MNILLMTTLVFVVFAFFIFAYKVFYVFINKGVRLGASAYKKNIKEDLSKNASIGNQQRGFSLPMDSVLNNSFQSELFLLDPLLKNDFSKSNNADPAEKEDRQSCIDDEKFNEYSSIKTIFQEKNASYETMRQPHQPISCNEDDSYKGNGSQGFDSQSNDNNDSVGDTSGSNYTE